MIGLICHLQQKELGHGAVDNPIYRFAIYYKFLWLLGPLSHRFVDCLLSWVLMSCCLNHCIITALIHFLACPHTRSVGSPLLEKNGLKHSSPSRQLVTSSWKRGVILRILPFNKWQSSCDLAECCHRYRFCFRWQKACWDIICSWYMCESNSHEQWGVRRGGLEILGWFTKPRLDSLVLRGLQINKCLSLKLEKCFRLQH